MHTVSPSQVVVNSCSHPQSVHEPETQRSEGFSACTAEALDGTNTLKGGRDKEPRTKPTRGFILRAPKGGQSIQNQWSEGSRAEARLSDVTGANGKGGERASDQQNLDEGRTF